MQKSIFFLIVILLFSHITIGQTVITKYYDSAWQQTSKDSAIYYVTFQKEDTFYKVNSYWIKSNKLSVTSTYADTNFLKAIGLQKRFYESGNLQDSVFYNNEGGIQTGYHYLENGHLDYKIFDDPKNGGISGEQYDSTGKKTTGYFTFEKEAIFPGGASAWATYLSSNLKSNVAAKHKAPPGRYTVTVSFNVDKNGKVTEVQALSNPGYGTAEEAMRVVQNSPTWNPAIQNNKPVIFRQRQNIVFEVTEK